eukprot:PhF_6_TR7388/c0_g1_i1/m.11104
MYILFHRNHTDKETRWTIMSRPAIAIHSCCSTSNHATSPPREPTHAHFFFMAALNGHADVVTRLMTLRADPFFQVEGTGWTPLHAALRNNQNESAVAILESCDRITRSVLVQLIDIDMSAEGVSNETVSFLRQQYVEFLRQE